MYVRGHIHLKVLRLDTLLLIRRQLQQMPVVAVLKDLDGAVLVLADAAHALAHAEPLGLLGGVAGNGDADDGLRAEARDNTVALPAGKQVALVNN